MSDGLLVVISGPSGAGKGTICKKLIDLSSDIELSVSATTREPRVGEINGISYYFITHDEFEARIKADDFFEYARVYGNYYGTPKSNILQKLKEGKTVILEIDIQGALQIKEKFPEGVLIFVAPPSIEELHRRIVNRGTDSLETINKRMQCTKDELGLATKYDYLVVNDDIDTAVKNVENIIISEKMKVKRNLDIISYIMEEKTCKE